MTLAIGRNNVQPSLAGTSLVTRHTAQPFYITGPLVRNFRLLCSCLTLCLLVLIMTDCPWPCDQSGTLDICINYAKLKIFCCVVDVIVRVYARNAFYTNYKLSIPNPAGRLTEFLGFLCFPIDPFNQYTTVALTVYTPWNYYYYQVSFSPHLRSFPFLSRQCFRLLPWLFTFICLQFFVLSRVRPKSQRVTNSAACDHYTTENRLCIKAEKPLASLIPTTIHSCK
jgi:hypothetical protein